MTRIKTVILSLLFLIVTIQGEEIYATFSVEAEKSANLAFTSSGTVKSINVEVATVVKKGELLAQLQNSDLKAALNIAVTALKYAKKEYDRQLKVQKLVDASKLDGYAFKYESAKAQVAYQQALLDKTLLNAPFHGIIFSKNIEEGDVVSAAMIRTVFKMQSIDKRKLVLEFDQKYWKDIKMGQRFTYAIDGDTKKYRGEISKIYPFADSGNRKIKAEVIVEDFVVGLFGDGYITVPDTK
ncbi:MAG: efflux RND transporter periplasmic adaptor subunit [Campylobacterota bacterium]|nr:efflux RND transporter periplasmic adaptor subunit [Campylobacterota bacterium]